MPRNQRTVYTYAHLLAVSRRSLKRAEAEERGRFYECMHTVLYSALGLEAFLNHLGERLLPFWPTLKRPLSPREKLDVICTHLTLNPDFGSRPFQSFTAAFRFRNLIAHAETHEVPTGLGASSPRAQAAPGQTEWESYCEPGEARRIAEDAERIVDELHHAAGLGPARLLTLETSTSTLPFD